MSPHEKDYDDVVADLTNENKMLREQLANANKALDYVMTQLPTPSWSTDMFARKKGEE